MSPVLSTFSGASARAFGFGYNFVSSAFEHIETQTVGAGGAASITFSNIPQTYKHLQVRGIARIDGGQNRGDLLINGDTTLSNYRFHALYGSGTSAASESYSPAADFIYTADSTRTANCFGATITDILDYTSTTKRKTVRSLTGVDTNGFGYIGLESSANYNTTAAVTSITLQTRSNNWVQYSTFSLYGCK